MINFENTVLTVTLKDVVQTFTETDLQKELPIFMTDVSTSTKDIVATYQKYLADGDYDKAKKYKDENVELNSLVLDSQKINSLWAYLAYAYLYASNRKQQISFSTIQPTDQEIGDFWMPYDPSSTNQNLPLYLKTDTDTYKQIWIASKYSCISDTEINKILSGKTTSTPNALLNAKGVSTLIAGYDKKVNDFFQSGYDLKSSVTDRVVAKGMTLSENHSKNDLYTTLTNTGSVAFKSITGTISSFTDETYDGDNEVYYREIVLPYSANQILYAHLQIEINETVIKYLVTAPKDHTVVETTKEIRKYNHQVFDSNNQTRYLYFRDGTSFDTTGTVYSQTGTICKDYTTAPSGNYSFRIGCDDENCVSRLNGITYTIKLLVKKD